MRVALGIAVFSGMLGVTVFGIFFTPVFYSVVRWLTERKAPDGLPGTRPPRRAIPSRLPRQTTSGRTLMTSAILDRCDRSPCLVMRPSCWSRGLPAARSARTTRSRRRPSSRSGWTPAIPACSGGGGTDASGGRCSTIPSSTTWSSGHTATTRRCRRRASAYCRHRPRAASPSGCCFPSSRRPPGVSPGTRRARTPAAAPSAITCSTTGSCPGSPSPGNWMSGAASAAGSRPPTPRCWPPWPTTMTCWSA